MNEQNWILCSDRLPPYEELVLVYRMLCTICYENPDDKKHSHKMVYRGEEMQTAHYWKGDEEGKGYWETHSVFAWMPLPKVPRLKQE